MVTVWGVNQLNTPNVNWARSTVASPVSAEDTSNVTVPVGSVLSTTVNVSVDPPSVTEAVVVDSVYPEVSSSVVVAVTAWLATPS